MFARVTCPACQYKLTIPEGDMTKRQVCPNCKSPFLAGKSELEPELEMKRQTAPESAYNKTMLGEMQPPIKYNCPRCNKPLESPASEAGTKKPCPACGQRLQVPAAPPPALAAAAPNLNKTMLAGDETRTAPPIKYNCPNCKKPLESPASEAGTKKPCPACGQRLQIPAAPPAGTLQPNLNKTILASDESKAQPYGQPGYAPSAPGLAPSGQPMTMPAGPAPRFPLPGSARNWAIGIGAFVLALIIIPALIRGGKREDPVELAKAQKELADLNAKIEESKAAIKRQEIFEENTRKQLEDMKGRITAQDEQMRDNHREALRNITDANKKREMEDKFAADERKRERENRDQETKAQKLLAEAKARLDESKRALDAANQRRDVIIQTPPPYIYHPPWHPRYYWPW